MFRRYQPGKARTVVDEDGREWLVEEILTSAQSDDLPTRSLIAWNGSVVRRTWTYPEHWEQLGDTELLALIDSAARDRRREA